MVDASGSYFEHHIQTVRKTLAELGLQSKPRLLVLNKADKIEPETAANLERRFDGVAVCALDSQSLLPLIEKMDSLLWP